MSLRFDAVLQLGKKVVDEMGIQSSVDTLGRWMVHYIAELVVEAQSAEGQTKVDAQARCREAILELWHHRHELPEGLRPFQDVEAIALTLQSLNLAPNSLRYFDNRIRSMVNCSETESTRWLDLATNLDSAAKMLIRYCLLQAAEAALDKNQAWVDLADQAGLGHSIESVMIRFLSQEANVLSDASATGEHREEIEDRLSHLRAFRQAASLLQSGLEERLAELSASDMNSESTNSMDRESDF
ncbi:MAG: AVAST type 3 anti-phage protein Avs3b [Bryobacteraceae bacterium]